MVKHGKKQKFADIWVTQTQLGKRFCLSAKEIGLKLNELALRRYDVSQHKYVPTQQALAERWCIATPLKHGRPFYLWHGQKVADLLQERLQLRYLGDAEIELRDTALYLIQAEKEAEEGNDKVYYLFYDTIAPEDLPAIIAWSLIETYKTKDPLYQRLVAGIAEEDAPLINRELERLGEDLRLDSEA